MTEHVKFDKWFSDAIGSALKPFNSGLECGAYECTNKVNGMFWFGFNKMDGMFWTFKPIIK